jgi:hypothetical protein
MQVEQSVLTYEENCKHFKIGKCVLYYINILQALRQVHKRARILTSRY